MAEVYAVWCVAQVRPVLFQLSGFEAGVLQVLILLAEASFILIRAELFWSPENWIPLRYAAPPVNQQVNITHIQIKWIRE